MNWLSLQVFIPSNMTTLGFVRVINGDMMETTTHACFVLGVALIFAIPT